MIKNSKGRSYPSLAESCPNVVRCWDYSKNDIDPTKIFKNCKDYAWFKCPDCGTEWIGSIAYEARKNIGCKVCSGNKKYAKQGVDDIFTLRPELALDWDYSLNTRDPLHLKLNANYTAYWVCHRCGHKWSSRLDSRTINGCGCPVCNVGGGSSCADYLLWLLLKPFGAEYRKRKFGYEWDIVIEDKNIFIEYDGYVWHNSADDDYKNSIAHKNGYKIYRIKERPDTVCEYSLLSDTVAIMPKLVLKTLSFYKRCYISILSKWGIIKDVKNISEEYICVTLNDIKGKIHFPPYKKSIAYALKVANDNGVGLKLNSSLNENINPKYLYANNNVYVWLDCKNSHTTRFRGDTLLRGYNCSVCSGRTIPKDAKLHELSYNMYLWSDLFDGYIIGENLSDFVKNKGSISLMCPYCRKVRRLNYNALDSRKTMCKNSNCGDDTCYVVILGKDDRNYIYYSVVNNDVYYLVQAISVQDDYILSYLNMSLEGIKELDYNMFKKYIGDRFLMRKTYNKYFTIPINIYNKIYLDVTSDYNIVDCYHQLRNQLNKVKGNKV